MRRMFSLFITLFLLQLSTTFAQISDYISEQRGDTLVVKDEFEYGAADALNLLMNADTNNVPEVRVYLLKNYGYYSLVNTPTSSATKKVIIMGESNKSVKIRKDDAFPPIVCGAVWEGGSSTGGLTSGHDLLVKNINANVGNSAGNIGWAFYGTSTGAKLTVENCITEHNQWTMINPGAGSKIIFKDSYFLNMVGHTCRRNGGIIDFFSNQDSILVENCTILNAQGSIFKFRSGYSVGRSTFNHNTFVNCAGYSFMNLGNTGNISITNNIFVNSNVQGYCSAFQQADAGEVDKDDLPMGFVNVYHDSTSVLNGETFYVDKNLIYWDPTFNDYISTLNANQVNGITNWQSQMITMNSRSQAMFDDNDTYPKLTEGTWIKGVLPTFADTKNLFTTQLAELKTYILNTVDTTSTATLSNWRLINTPASDYYTYSDWPIQVDLSYSNSDLLTAGLNGFPVGDLDWFPTQYAQWSAQKATEYEAIHKKLYNIVGVNELPEIPESYQLGQNYPNPFNPTTVISYTIPKAGNVSLKVYNVIGQEVATLFNGYQEAAKYQVSFNASDLASGIYIYTINAGSFSQSKKMMLIK
jgi:hypothetical protein